MAFPTIPTAGAGRVVTGNVVGASGTRTFPDLGSLTKNAGDLLIAIIVAYQSSSGAGAPGGTVFSSWGGSFTEFCDQMTTNSSTMAIGAAYKISTGSETGTFTVTQAATVTGGASYILLSIPGADQATAPEEGTIANGTTAAADPGSFSPSWGALDTLWIAVAGNGETSGTGSWTGIASAPTNFGNYADAATADTSTVGECEAAVAFRQQNAASQDVSTFTQDLSNARNSALVIAVKPATEHLIAFDFPLNLAVDTNLSPVEKVIAFDFLLGLAIDTNLTVETPAPLETTDTQIYYPVHRGPF